MLFRSKDIPRVFDKFYSTWRRMDDRTQGGLGLGLALSREIVRAHGGGIEVRSQVGQGSTFTVTLPVPDSQVATDGHRLAAPQVVEQFGGQRG